MFNYRLHIYDSFEGVEELSPEMKLRSHDFSGAYSSPESILRQNLEIYGEISICSIHKGWFADTLASNPLSCPIRIVYIDCDIAKGTREVLRGAIPNLVQDGWIFSQDFHIDPVRELLNNPDTWKQMNSSIPKIKWVSNNLASIRIIK